MAAVMEDVRAEERAARQQHRNLERGRKTAERNRQRRRAAERAVLRRELGKTETAARHLLARYEVALAAYTDEASGRKLDAAYVALINTTARARKLRAQLEG